MCAEEGQGRTSEGMMREEMQLLECECCVSGRQEGLPEAERR